MLPLRHQVDLARQVEACLIRERRRLVRVSVQLDEGILEDIQSAARDRGEKLPVVVREWLRLGRDEYRRRTEQQRERGAGAA